VEEYPLTLIIDTFTKESMELRLAKEFNFVKPPTKEGESKPIAPPTGLINTLLKDSYKRAPSLVGTIEHPVVRGDGTVLTETGYDKKTGFFSRIPKSIVPHISDNITTIEANDALKWIVCKALVDFPFADTVAACGAAALLLTAVQRRMITEMSGAPIFLLGAPIYGTGKTALAQLVFLLVYGRVPAAASWSHRGEEMEKRILSILLEGHPGVVFDNIGEGTMIRSDALAAATTSTTFTSRILGFSRTATVPTNVVWMLTGNNLLISGDFMSRILPIYLDANVEDPTKRTFSRPDLVGWCDKNRAQFFKAAITILAGYHQHRQSGKSLDFNPKDIASRFKQWDQLVRYPIMWAEGEDVIKLFEQNVAESSEGDVHTRLLKYWHEAYGEEPVATHEVLKKIDGGTTHEELKNAVHDIIGDAKISPRILGRRLGKIKNRVFSGLKIVEVRTEKARGWRVRKVKS
jgi:hypothetical protein